jgi:hypothetical protein
VNELSKVKYLNEFVTHMCDLMCILNPQIYVLLKLRLLIVYRNHNGEVFFLLFEGQDA